MQVDIIITGFDLKLQNLYLLQSLFRTLQKVSNISNMNKHIALQVIYFKGYNFSSYLLYWIMIIEIRNESLLALKPISYISFFENFYINLIKKRLPTKKCNISHRSHMVNIKCFFCEKCIFMLKCRLRL